MKNNLLNVAVLSVVSLGCLSLLVTGCDKPATPVSDGTTNVVAAVEAAKPAGEAAQPVAAVTAAVDEAKGIIAQAQSLVAANKYSEAGTELQKLASLKLSTDQQSLVDGLKQQIQQALTKQATDGAAKTVGGLLGK